MARDSWVETDWGYVQLTWTDQGLLRSYLPTQAVATGEPLPAALRPCADWLRAYFAGRHPQDIDFPCDPSACTASYQEIYRQARLIPAGQVRTYGQLAALCGRPKAARWVGTALGRNPWPPFVPCHRVVAANGKPGGFSAPGGVDTKLRMLLLEAHG